MFNERLVAVYGSLRKGLGNHRVLGDSTLLGTDVVSGWEMFSLGGFPGIRSGLGSIVVEVYLVDNEAIAEALDRLEGYRGPDANNFYDKETVFTQYGEASIYTLQEGYDGSNIVEKGDWVGYRTPSR